MIDKRVTTNLRSKIRWGVVGILVLFSVASVFVYPQKFNAIIDKTNNVTSLGLPKIPEKSFRLGLDLQGGVHLVYKADVSRIDGADQSKAVEGVRDVIDRRVNGMGVAEPVVQTTKVGEDYRLIVELPGVTDVNQAIKMIGETPILEFKEINNDPPRELTAEEKKQLDDFNVEAKKKAEQIQNKVNKGEKIEDLALANTEDERGKNNSGYLGFVKKYSVDNELYKWAETVSANTITKKIFETSEGYNIFKKGSEKENGTEVKARHILICFLGSTGCEKPDYNKDEAYQKIQEVYQKANANNFTELAKEFSNDEANKNNGGDLGWFDKGRMVPAFDEAIFSAQKGQIIGPVETEFGYHVIYKEDEKPLKDYEMWRILIKTKKETDIVPPQEPWKTTGLSGKQLERSEVISDQQTGAVLVSLNFNDEGKNLFKDITTRNVGKQVAIFLDGEAISAPNVDEPITEGKAVIKGRFTLKEAQLLSQRLNAGALPIPVELISQQKVDATLGMDSLNKSLKAGIIGFIAVVIFMILYYRFPGILAVFALALYAVLTLTLFKLIGVTLTLSGIAGFILSVGMAVDANVLIFERLKEELRSGRILKSAVEESFVRAWPSIRDSNITTLISCFFLMWLSGGFVKGFAITLSIGVLISMFTAITITKNLFRFICPFFPEYGNWMFWGFSKKDNSEIKK